MSKLWEGRDSGIIDEFAEQLNSSIGVDKRLYKEDISGSVAHAEMLAKQGIISEEDKKVLVGALNSVLCDIENGTLQIDETSEDIHTFIEGVLTERVGATGKKLHTARSRNDQVALDLRLFVKKEIIEIIELLKNLVLVITDKAEESKEAVCPGYTHLQRAQPITFGQHLLAYVFMFIRDIERLKDAYKRVDVSPIGSCALAGTTYDTDRFFEAEKLGFSTVCLNSIDGVSDRDFCVEYISALALVQTHLSRFAEELVLWSSWEFKFVELSPKFTTGSSIMPQKKNPDIAELTRGKTGRVYGDLVSILTILKGLPLAYNKDMQEDKEAVFDAGDTVKLCLKAFIPMVGSMKPLKDNMKKAAQKGFINATDLADYLVKKGEPFRNAYKICGEIVGDCIKSGKILEMLTLSEYKKYSDMFENDLYQAIDLNNCVNKRASFGGTAPSSVEKQILFVKEYIAKFDIL